MKSCPYCAERIQDAAIKCRFCGEFLHTRANDEAPPAASSYSASGDHASSVKQNDDAGILHRLRTDFDDVTVFIPEVMRVFVRMNPVNMEIDQFNETLHSIQEGMERSQVSAIVEHAIMSVDLGGAVGTLQSHDGIVQGFAEELFSETEKDLIATVPYYRHYMPDLPDGRMLGSHASARILHALHRNRQSLEVIQAHFRQLQSYLPRYRSIMNRSGVFDFVVGLAAGFFGGALGQVGAELWDDWRGQSDSQFIDSFSAAVDQFSNAGIQYIQQVEINVDPVIAQLAGDLGEYSQIVIRGLERYVGSGGDPTPFYEKCRKPSEPLSEEAKNFFETVLEGLRSRGASGRFERNVREMIMGA